VSPVITAMLGQGRAESALRVSLGEETDDAAIEAVIRLLFQVVARQVSGERGPT
jgi:cysteine sulfinate desulfinase/cysteine desulfurase-like protein